MVERYGAETRLQENQLYMISLMIKGQEIKQVSFTSKYNPLFSTVRIIRSDFKDLFSKYTNDDINRLIYENSQLAIEMVSASTTANITIDVTQPDGVPYAVKQFVRYKTELDLATDLFLYLTSQSGQEDRMLGDMRITKQVQLPYINQIMNLLQKRSDAWEFQLTGMKAPPTSAVRAGSTTYPLNGRVSF